MSDVMSAPDMLQPVTIDFNSLHEQAMAHPSDPTADELVETQSSEHSPVPQMPDFATMPTRTENGASNEVFDIPDTAMVRVKIDGTEQIVPYKEYKDGVQREAVFTKRMQTLATQRQEAEQVFSQRAADLQRQAEMIAYAQQQMQYQAAPRAPEPQAQDPNEIATLGEVQQSLAAFQQQLAVQQQSQQQQFMQQLQQAGQQLKDEQSAQANAMTFTAGLNAALEQEDVRFIRDAIPFAEESLRFQVAQLEPQSIAEAITFAEQIAKEWAGKVRATSTDYLTRQEVAKARAKMGPPSGSPPPPSAQARPATFFKKDGQIDWKGLERVASTYMDR